MKTVKKEEATYITHRAEDGDHVEFNVEGTRFHVEVVDDELHISKVFAPFNSGLSIHPVVSNTIKVK